MVKKGGDARKARFGVLRLIALFKISKVILLLATAYGVLRLRDASVIARLYGMPAGAAILRAADHRPTLRGACHRVREP